jgi:murein DD-endopeptidase MepM/ murein hydrolase activator NlpD
MIRLFPLAAGVPAVAVVELARALGASTDSLWLANGQGTAAPRLRLPLSSHVLSSGFGLRAEPLDQPSMPRPGGGGLSSANAAVTPFSPLGFAPAARGAMAPHDVPIFAAGDGIVKGAAPKGRSGNWIEIDHPANPLVYSALRRSQLRGPDLDRFRKLVAADLAERQRETSAVSAGL